MLNTGNNFINLMKKVREDVFTFVNDLDDDFDSDTNNSLNRAKNVISDFEEFYETLVWLSMLSDEDYLNKTEEEVKNPEGVYKGLE